MFCECPGSVPAILLQCSGNVSVIFHQCYYNVLEMFQQLLVRALGSVRCLEMVCLVFSTMRHSRRVRGFEICSDSLMTLCLSSTVHCHGLQHLTCSVRPWGSDMELLSLIKPAGMSSPGNIDNLERFQRVNNLHHCRTSDSLEMILEPSPD